MVMISQEDAAITLYGRKSTLIQALMCLCVNLCKHVRYMWVWEMYAYQNCPNLLISENSKLSTLKIKLKLRRNQGTVFFLGFSYFIVWCSVANPIIFLETHVRARKHIF